MRPEFDDSFYERVRDDLWSALDIHCGGYSSDVDEQLVAVIKGIGSANHWGPDIAKGLGLQPQYVEFIQYVLCSAGWAEYGTSPRGCWLDHRIDKERLFKAMDEWFEKAWEPELPTSPSQ